MMTDAMKAIRMAGLGTALGLVSLTLAAPGAAAATFSDRTVFQQGLTGTLEDFENGGAPGVPSATFPAFRVFETGGNAGVTTSFQPNPGFATSPDTYLGVFLSDAGDLVFDSFAPGTTAFGLDFGSTVDETITVTLNGSTTTSFVASAESPVFFGVSEEAGLTSVAFGRADGAAGNLSFGVDDVFVGATVVPLPGALGLMLAGLGALAVMGRRRAG